MKNLLSVAVVLPLVASARILGDLPDETHAWSVHDPNRPRPPVVNVDAKGVPSDAVILLDGTEATYRANWRSHKDSRLPAPWKVEGDDVVSSGGSIETVRTFGDCQLHVEWCAPDDTNRQHGNSGVYLMNRYEIQIINSHEIAPGKYHEIIRSADEQAGSVYGQKPPLVNPIHKPGEWQTYDIVFHQPVRTVDGKVVRPGTLTVFFNGVVVQDDREIEGPTLYCDRAVDVAHATKGPLQLQDHDGNVRFRNVWIRELVSPLMEDVLSGTSTVCRKDVAEQRVKTARKMLLGLKDIPDYYDRLVSALEMLTYSTEEPFLSAATELADAQVEELAAMDEPARGKRIGQLGWYFTKMRKAGCLPLGWKLVDALRLPQPPRISMFGEQIQREAKRTGETIPVVIERFYAAGVRGFDCDYKNPDLPVFATSRLKAVNLFGCVNFASSDGGQAESDALVAQAVKYGVRRIMIIPNWFRKDGDRESEFVMTVKGLRYLAKTARERDVTPMIEDFGGADNPCSYVKYLKRYLEEIPELSFALDAGNLHYAGRGEDILEMMRFAQGRIAHVHLKDFQKGSNRIRTTIGIGEVPNAQIVRTMRAKGYTGWFTLEDLVGDVVEDAARQVETVRRWFGEGE